jgi:cyclopropane fatty-acyl-phospholipid synthase-like methyltransferase
MQSHQSHQEKVSIIQGHHRLVNKDSQYSVDIRVQDFFQLRISEDEQKRILNMMDHVIQKNKRLLEAGVHLEQIQKTLDEWNTRIMRIEQKARSTVQVQHVQSSKDSPQSGESSKDSPQPVPHEVLRMTS